MVLVSEEMMVAASCEAMDHLPWLLAWPSYAEREQTVEEQAWFSWAAERVKQFADWMDEVGIAAA